MRLLLAILLILIGSLLIGLTVNSLGKTGNLIMNLIGIGFHLGAIFVVRRKKTNSHLR
ncbi:serine kinase [Bacillus sp. AK128]